jgi:hypothetical protein
MPAHTTGRIEEVFPYSRPFPRPRMGNLY